MQKINKKTTTYPFDWILSTPKIIFEILKLLLVDNMDINELVKEHFFKCEGKVNMKFPEHYYTDNDNNGKLHNIKNNLIFPHDNDSIESIDKYIRRFTRLKDDIINSKDEICFVYTSQSDSQGDGNFSINGINQISDVYIYLNKIYDMIEKIRCCKDYKFKMIIFDATRVEDKNVLNKNIIQYQLQSSGDWIGIEQQLHNYASLF